MTYWKDGAYWRGNESISDEFRSSPTERALDLEERMRARTDVPVLGSRAERAARAVRPYEWDDEKDHTIAQLRLRLQMAETDRTDYMNQARQGRTANEALLKERTELKAAVDKLVQATGGLTVEFQRQGAFTIAVLVDPTSQRVFTGAACCNAEDTFNDEIGRAISLGRAMNARAEYFADYAFAK